MSNLKIITASERVRETKGIKGCILGKSGIGKTSLLRTLPVDSTLFVDIEAGDLAVKDCQADTIRPRTWEDCRNLACFIGGSNPALINSEPYCADHYEDACKKLGDVSQLDKYATIFIDSITAAGRLCFNWCKQHPQSLSERTGKLDVRAAYRLHAEEMIGWLMHLQHTRDKNVWFLGILDDRMDEFNRRFFQLQMAGSKTGLELPGIVDQVITMAEMTSGDNESYRAFVCQTMNKYGYPAKDRSGKLNEIEEPDLGKLMQKISSAKVTRETSGGKSLVIEQLKSETKGN